MVFHTWAFFSSAGMVQFSRHFGLLKVEFESSNSGLWPLFDTLIAHPSLLYGRKKNLSLEI